LPFTRPFDPSLLDALEERIVQWAGECWRQVFEGTEPLKANVRGSRWNPPGVEALYVSLSAETAAAEISHLVSRQPLPITAPRITYKLRASLDKVIKLEELSSLEQFGLTAQLLFGDSHDAPRHLGDAANWLGCQGLLIPSARHEGHNLVIFMNNLSDNSGIDVLYREA
jgi:RES domain-containing protein